MKEVEDEEVPGGDENEEAFAYEEEKKMSYPQAHRRCSNDQKCLCLLSQC